VQKSTAILMIVSQLIPGTLPFISFYFLMFNAHLTNTYQGLVIAYTVWGIPFCTLMMKSYFSQSVPMALEESATIDGCSRLGIFFKIALPISVPGIAATAIYSFILAWNEFMWASVILTDNALKPASVGIYDYIGQYGGISNMSLTVTTAVIITFPAIILFGFLQKYLISGLSAGAVKG
jgi:ABC-type glycerol-3-phosphate transport system permease component